MASAAVAPVAVRDALDQAADVVDRVLKSLGRENNANAGVLTSRDAGVIAAKPELTDLVAPHFAGVKRWFVPVAPVLPVEWTGRFSAYTTYLASGASVTQRTLDAEVGALKIIVSGSIQFGETTLTSGDWVWLAPGSEYSFQAEEAGASVFTMMPCVQDLVDAEAGLPNKLIDGTFITSQDAAIKSQTFNFSHLENHFEAGQGITHKAFPFAPRLFQTVNKPNGRFWAWLANLEPGTNVTPHFHESESLGDVKLVVSGSIVANGKELTAGDWFWAPAEGPYNFTAGERGALLVGSWPHNVDSTH